MKKYLFFFCFSAVFSVSAQISYDFAQAVPPSGTKVFAVSQNYFGIYSNPDSPVKYEVAKDGIFIISTNITSISRETIRESSQYMVRNNHIFGVHAEDSIPCVLEGDHYYFGVKSRDQLIGGTSKNVLIQKSVNEYVINFYENGHYVPMFISFTAQGMSRTQFDYDSDTKAFKKIDDRTIVQKDIEFVTLNPTAEEWEKIKWKELIAEPLLFTKE